MNSSIVAANGLPVENAKFPQPMATMARDLDAKCVIFTHLLKKDAQADTTQRWYAPGTLGLLRTGMSPPHPKWCKRYYLALPFFSQRANMFSSVSSQMTK